MQIEAIDVEDYISKIPEDRREPMQKIRRAILDNIPKGFEEVIGYGMIGYVVPHSIFPAGYHCNPKLPLPFMNIASQKNFISLYHMGMYGDPKLFEWFATEYSKRYNLKPNMGKSCTQFKKMDLIPFELIGELASKMSCETWIEFYQKNYTKNKKTK